MLRGGEKRKGVIETDPYRGKIFIQNSPLLL
jgi:hypothetical protein